jgi:hypothetical protein
MLGFILSYILWENQLKGKILFEPEFYAINRTDKQTSILRYQYRYATVIAYK